MEKMTKESAMQKFMLAKKRKEEMVATIKEQLTSTYERETGLKANYFFSM